MLTEDDIKCKAIFELAKCQAIIDTLDDHAVKKKLLLIEKSKKLRFFIKQGKFDPSLDFKTLDSNVKSSKFNERTSIDSPSKLKNEIEEA